MAKNRRSFSPEFKGEAVTMVIEESRAVSKRRRVAEANRVCRAVTAAASLKDCSTCPWWYRV